MRPTPYITKENAAQCARNAARARVANNLRKKAERAAADRALIIHEENMRLKYLAQIATANASVPVVAAVDDYIGKRLGRVRLQIDQLDAMLLAERDPQALDRLAAASARLSEQERILAGRPLPGSHRPTKAPRAKQGDQSVTPE